MSTTFAEIDHMVGERVEQRFAQPDLPVPKKLIAGLAVPDLVEHDRQTTDYRTRISKYRQDRGMLGDTLAKHDIKPLAMLPAKTWDSILARHGLYRFQPNENGEVAASVRDLPLISKLGQVVNIGSWLAPWVALYIAYREGADHGFREITGIDMQITFWIMFAMGIAYGVMVCFAKKSPLVNMHAPCTRFLMRLYGWFPHRVRARRFFPNRQQVEQYTDGARMAKVVFPPVPTFVAALIEKAGTLTTLLQVAVVEDAFRIAMPPIQLFEPAFYRETERRRQRHANRVDNTRWAISDFWEALKADPILYTQQGEAVAILAQYGDFPLEKAIVQQVVENPDFLF
jgi:hypothetical protein